jgi:hypothetical protein
MPILIPSHKELNPFSALEYAITIPEHRIDFLHITSDKAIEPTVTVEEITEQRPDELSQASVDELVDRMKTVTDGTGREIRMLHTTGPIGEATIRYADALKSELIIVGVNGNEATRDATVNEAVDMITDRAPAAYTIIRE